MMSYWDQAWIRLVTAISDGWPMSSLLLVLAALPLHPSAAWRQALFNFDKMDQILTREPIVWAR
jgi:hypothetical protein